MGVRSYNTRSRSTANLHGLTVLGVQDTWVVQRRLRVVAVLQHRCVHRFLVRAGHLASNRRHYATNRINRINRIMCSLSTNPEARKHRRSRDPAHLRVESVSRPYSNALFGPPARDSPCSRVVKVKSIAGGGDYDEIFDVGRRPKTLNNEIFGPGTYNPPQ